MNVVVEEQIAEYLASVAEPKRSELRTLNEMILKTAPGCRLWYSDGRNDEGKVVSNPNIGYGEYTIQYADGSNKEFFQVGLSGNSSGITVYIMGLEDKTYLKRTLGDAIGKATVTGHCIKFKKIKEIDLEVLLEVVRNRLRD